MSLLLTSLFVPTLAVGNFTLFGLGLVDLLILAVVVVAVFAIANIFLRRYSGAVPGWLVELFWIVVAAVVVIIAIKVIVSLL